MTISTYHPSGRIPRQSFRALGIAGLAAAGSAVAYAWLMAYARPAVGSETGYLLTLFALLGVGISMYTFAHRAATVGKVRNPVWMGRAGAVLGLLAWYVQWAAYIVMDGIRFSGDALGFSALEFIARLCLRPGAMFDWAFTIPLIDKSMFTQCGLVFCWLVEFCVYIVPPMLAGRGRAAMPFCEAGNQWAREIEVETDFEPFADLEAVRRLIEAEPGRFAAMLVPRKEDAVGSHTRVTLYVCAGPESFITISHCEQKAVENIPLPPEVVGAMAAGASDVECYWEQPIVERLRVPLPDPNALLRRWSGQTEAKCQPGPVLAKM
ncbi:MULTISPECIES: hypothetical protein [unclassified Massilia]|uniref:hypothetical protein n=1 Tax=unclassified Massilia TaxID=2609279 RepID=UPI0017842C77|nr:MULTISPECIES: hypothetical protein [unclassified Massilia]MBD8528392.1 hypothetical protein [Massilia sp. CFBP 13647]MBD8671986.1 hypothetical protein [Massilia sp. CFBP 13721]